MVSNFYILTQLGELDFMLETSLISSCIDRLFGSAYNKNPSCHALKA